MFIEIITNKVLILPICSWAIAQIMKVIIILLWKKRLDLRFLVSSGGMPSSHSAFVTALATSVALIDGLGSVVFGISAILALVVIYDAAGVRRSVGQQAKIINRMMRELKDRRPVAELGHDLRELVGHTQLQVIVGGLLGIVVAWAWFIIAGA
ncbi:divergent PAP2 family protein [Chloroflexota bacterium]